MWVWQYEGKEGENGHDHHTLSGLKTDRRQLIQMKSVTSSHHLLLLSCSPPLPNHVGQTDTTQHSQLDTNYPALFMQATSWCGWT